MRGNTESYVCTHYLTTSVLIFFEYLLIFDQEVRLFWGKKLTGAVALFFANRYTTIVYTIYSVLVDLVPAASASAQVCSPPLPL